MIFAFEPKDDLTVLELALIVSKVHGNDWSRIEFPNQPPEKVIRHFRLVSVRVASASSDNPFGTLFSLFGLGK